jgi:hypothetical protein
MATLGPIRAALAVVLLTRADAAAQVSVAPPPHPALVEVVKEYQRLGLPVPPPGAEFVRIERWHFPPDLITDDAPARPTEPLPLKRQQAFWLGFRLPPPWAGADPRYLLAADPDWTLDDEWFDPRCVSAAPPTHDALRQVDAVGAHYLFLAVQAKLRGWDELASAAYARALADYQSHKNALPVFDEMRGWAWRRWLLKLVEPGSDRKVILGELRKLSDGKPATVTSLNRLARSLVRNGKPGTVDALIDDLTEYWEVTWGPPFGPRFDLWDTKWQEPYWRLAELGFDAIPALIDHIEDDRHARGAVIVDPFTDRRPSTVGGLCNRLLYQLSGGIDPDGRFSPAAAREWFDAAKKVGEEKWLLDHVFSGGDVRREIARAIVAKYPARVPELVREGWRKDGIFLLVPELVAGKLPRAQKITLLEEGLTQPQSTPRRWALEGLSRVDRPLFRRHLRRQLEALRDELAAGRGWFCDPADFVGLVEDANDPTCWDLLAACAKRSPVARRMSVISNLGLIMPPDRIDPARAERVRFLAQFLDDRARDLRKKGENDFWEWDESLEVRDLAASELALLFRFDLQRDPSQPEPTRMTDLGPVSRLVVREMMRAAARELGGNRK